MNLKGNYAPTFTWWDKIFGTDIQYKEYYTMKKEEDVKKQKWSWKLHNEKLIPKEATRPQRELVRAAKKMM